MTIKVATILLNNPTISPNKYSYKNKKQLNTVSFCSKNHKQNLKNLIDSKYLLFKPRITFIDNNTPSDPSVIKARYDFDDFLNKKGLGMNAYFEDQITQRAKIAFKEKFGTNEVYFVPSGTASNVLGLMSINQTNNSIIAAESAHIHANENLALQNHIKANLIKIPSKDGKITVEQIKKSIGETSGTGTYNHPPQPKTIFITQPTELGTIYSLDEIKAIADFAHSQKPQMSLIMDGARLSQACAKLGVSYKEMTKDLGVDVLSFGLTKNGVSEGNSLVFINESIVKRLKNNGLSINDIIKSNGWMKDKGWYIPLEYTTMLDNGQDLKNARHANELANYLAEKLQKELPSSKLMQTVDSNAVFVELSFNNKYFEPLAKKYNFYVWDKKETSTIIRLMTSFITDKEKHIRPFINDLKKICR